MKPHPRIRKFIKWGGLVVSVLLLTLWVGSAFAYLGYNNRNGQMFHFVWGQYVHRPSVPGNHGFFAEEISQRQIRWSVDSMQTNLGAYVFIPLWPFVLISIATTATAWRMDTLAHRRKRRGVCPACNYDRTGLAANAPCPECNSPTP